MKRMLLLLSVSAVILLMFASTALADHHTAMSTASSSAMSSSSASAMSSASASPLPGTGGPPLVLGVTLAATLIVVGSGFAALTLLRSGAR